MASSDFFSLPRSCAFLGSFQIVGSSISSFTCSSFSDFLSKSKIPPKFGFTRRQVGEQGGEGVDAFGFHVFFFSQGEIKPEIIPEPGHGRAVAARAGGEMLLFMLTMG
jgi:hypothetical protein